ncbi:hypothetical protein LSUE1_G005172 [Lachnellula suecica]|uniref:Uncharacterized protein n=1 Tax=Lachnellula suecica TaxID=602035 RepID=A0A8T9C1X3_9HELO|nr:hypothetical protein LSUE1_G005172 [Lachnellula suecica]
MAPGVYARQTFVDDNGNVFEDDGRGFWWTRTGQIVRWSIFLGLFSLFIAYMIIGYWHAKRRIRKGQAPLAYHRWLLNRQQRAQYDPHTKTLPHTTTRIHPRASNTACNPCRRPCTTPMHQCHPHTSHQLEARKSTPRNGEQNQREDRQRQVNHRQTMKLHQDLLRRPSRQTILAAVTTLIDYKLRRRGLYVENLGY